MSSKNFVGYKSKSKTTKMFKSLSKKSEELSDPIIDTFQFIAGGAMYVFALTGSPECCNCEEQNLALSSINIDTLVAEFDCLDGDCEGGYSANIAILYKDVKYGENQTEGK